MRFTLGVIFFLFVVSLLPRIALLSAGPHHYDTLDYILRGKETLETGRLHYAHGVGYPFTVILSAISQIIFRYFSVDEVKAVLIMGAIGASLAVIAFFLFVQMLFKNWEISFFSSIIFSFFPTFFSITTHGRLDHVFALFFVISSLYFLLKYIETRNTKLLAMSSVLFGLGIGTRFSEIWAALPYFFAYSFFHIKVRKNELIISKNAFTIDKLACLILPAATITSILYFPMFLTYGISRFIEVISNPYQAQWLGIYTPLLNLSVGWIVNMFTYLGIALLVIGTYFIIKERQRFVGLFSLVWVLTLTLYFGNLSTVSPRYLILPSLPLFFISGFSIYRINKLRKYLGYVILLILIFLMISPIYPILEFRHKHNLQKEFAAYLKNITEEDAIILAQDEVIFLRYYLKGNRTITSFPITCNKTEMIEFFRKMNSWLKQNKSVYIIETGFAYDPCKLFLRGLANYEVILVGKHLNEDWHHKCIFWGVFEERVFRILPKTI